MFLLNSDSVSLYEQVNDTVGALSLGYYHDPDTVVAVVFGTGSNACYLERTDAIIKCQGLLTTSGSMVLRIISWSIFRSQLMIQEKDVLKIDPLLCYRWSIWSGEIFGPHICLELPMTLTWMQRVQMQMIW